MRHALKMLNEPLSPKSILQEFKRIYWPGMGWSMDGIRSQEIPAEGKNIYRVYRLFPRSLLKECFGDISAPPSVLCFLNIFLKLYNLK